MNEKNSELSRLIFPRAVPFDFTRSIFPALEFGGSDERSWESGARPSYLNRSPYNSHWRLPVSTTMDRSPRVGVPGLHGWFSESEALLDGTPEALERFAQIILGGCDSIEVHLETTGDTALPNEGLLSAIIIRTRPLPVLVIFREGFQLI